jgi:hypothetical protein
MEFYEGAMLYRYAGTFPKDIFIEMLKRLLNPKIW